MVWLPLLLAAFCLSPCAVDNPEDSLLVHRLTGGGTRTWMCTYTEQWDSVARLDSLGKLKLNACLEGQRSCLTFDNQARFNYRGRQDGFLNLHYEVKGTLIRIFDKEMPQLSLQRFTVVEQAENRLLLESYDLGAAGFVHHRFWWVPRQR